MHETFIKTTPIGKRQTMLKRKENNSYNNYWFSLSSLECTL